MPEGGGHPPTLADLGEWELIDRLGSHAPAGQFGDDAALLPERTAGVLVLNTDVLVEGVHFSDATMEAADVGWRAAAVNFSDLAAMGCREVVGLTLALVAPATTSWSWVDGVYAGLSAALERYGGTLLGGDCSGGEQRVLAVSALGRLGPDGPIRRADGRAGDALISTGPHGLSRLGLAVVKQDPAGPGEADWRLASRSLLEQAVRIHRRPLPRLDAVAALASTRPANCPWRVGGTDSSDGLAAAVTALARSSGCDAFLERDLLPLPGEMAAWPQGERWCLSGGEDFELVLALEPGWAEALSGHLPGARRIGWLAPGAGVVRWACDGAPLGSDGQGYTHFH